jgi:hypothetical protein
MFAALSKLSNDAGGVNERGSIIRQRCTEPIIVLVLRPPDCEKVPRHRAPSLAPFFMWETKAALQELLASLSIVHNFVSPAG